MPAILFIAVFFLYIYCEISLLVAIGSSIGVLPLILLMIAISAAGLWLIKLRGNITLLEIRSQLAQGKVPTQAVISSVLFAMAGVLLLIPGILSDILAILLVLPVTKHLAQAYLAKLFASKIRFSAFGQQGFSQQTSHQNAETFEAEFERQQDKDRWVK